MEWDYDSIAMNTEIPELYRAIKLLMDETYLAREKGKKLVLALIEYHARERLACIQRRTSIRN